jgi:hypothetical protein
MSPDEDNLDEEFPLGDGTALTSAEVRCPYCGEINEIALDPGSGSEQDYVEDCQVCCRPWSVRVHYLPDGSADVSLEPEDSV